ncbi:MAG: NADH-dependent phenylglyoxylate [Clostridiales bacterium]|nr:NADH-dependent phenylglyoxylate [Clostridiales bacterium]MCF8022040.1 NADH-dependent phenylglyoxylate [Clostridiales bacterium]
MKYRDILMEQEDLVSPGISACQGCGAELCLRTALRVLGKNTVVAIPPGCLAGAGVVGWNYDNGLKIPVHITLLDNTASFLAGVKELYDYLDEDVQVVAIAGDGATADCGFQSLSGAAERGHNIIYICYDNEGYMNTGFQRSGTTTKGSHTSTTPVGSLIKGKAQHKKDMPMIMAMHNAAYVATLNPAYMKDFVSKLKKAMSVKEGLSYLHVCSPCPTGWRFNSDLSIEVARKAVKTNFFPLYEYENNSFKLKKVANPEPVSNFLKLSKKFKHLDEKDIEEIQAHVDEKYNNLVNLAGENIN